MSLGPSQPMRAPQRECLRSRPYPTHRQSVVLTPNDSDPHLTTISNHRKPPNRHVRRYDPTSPSPSPSQHITRPPASRRSSPSPPPYPMDYAQPSCSYSQPSFALSSQSSRDDPATNRSSSSFSSPHVVPEQVQDDHLPPLPPFRHETSPLASSDSPEAQDLLVRALTQLREIWSMPDRLFPPGFDAVTFFRAGSSTSTNPVYPNPLTAPPPHPEAVAAAAAVHADQMLSPPEESTDESESDSPSEGDDSDDDESGSESESESPASSSVTPGDSSPLSSPISSIPTMAPLPAVTSHQAMPPHLLHHHMTPPGTASALTTSHPSTAIPPAVLAAYTQQSADRKSVV